MPRLSLGDRLVDLDSGTLHGPPGAGSLRPLELALLRRLYDAHGEVVSRAELLVDVFGYSPVSRSRTLDATVARLRHRIEDDPTRPAFVLTSHGEGYTLLRRPPRSGRPLIGRGDLLDRVARWLPTGGWLTLAGPGGIGKTRLLEAIADLPRGGRTLVHVDVPNEGPEALAAAVRGAQRVVLADLGASPPGIVDAVDGPATVVIASRLVLDRVGETVIRVPPVDGVLPLAIAVAGSPDADARIRENLASTLALLSPRARAAWAALPNASDPAAIDELAAAGVACWRDGVVVPVPYLVEARSG